MVWLDVLTRVLTVLGIPTVVGWALYDRKRIRNEGAKGAVEVEEAEETLPHRVRSSSVVTLEAEIMALSNSFDTDRRIKDETIAFLQAQLAEAREEIEARDEMIDSLQEQVRTLRANVNQVNRDLDRLQGELETLRNHQEKGKGSTHGATQ